jgi:carbamoyltransferase
MYSLSIYPLPLTTYTHDASAALLTDDKVLFAYEEEKISRFQHSIGVVPENAAIEALSYSGIHPRSIGQLVVTSIDSCLTRADFQSKIGYLRELLLLDRKVKVECVPHHLAHSALAVLTSPFEKCVFLTMDAGGDGKMGHWGVFDGKTFSVRETFDLSPAVIYGFLTSLAGFGAFDEGKLMGLSAYGETNERLYNWLRTHFWIRTGSAALETSAEVVLNWTSEVKLDAFDSDAPRRHKYVEVTPRFTDTRMTEWIAEILPVDIAATGQRFYEELIVRAVRNIVNVSGQENLAVSGGAFQNVVINAKLRHIEGLHLHVPIATHDAGLALGAGLLAVFLRTGRRVGSRLSPYLGPSFTSSEILAMIKNFNVEHREPNNLNAAVVDELLSGKVVGWFQGRAEFGARSLGARSVLADPRDFLTKGRVNQALKKRDWFMPYAPSILQERGAEYFTNYCQSPYMNAAFQIRPSKASLIPAGVHVDGSCRVHSVSKRTNPRYHDLITQFARATNIPLILNTSFNRHGIPILSTPRQALQHFLENNVDSLAIGPFLLTKKGQPLYESTLITEDEYLAIESLQFIAGLIRNRKSIQAIALLNTFEPSISLVGNRLFSGTDCLWAITEEVSLIRSRWIALSLKPKIIRSKRIRKS